MRLIDADALNERFEKVKKGCASLSDIARIIGVQSVIDSQPTAYDVDKVTEQLRNVSVPEDKVLYLDPDKFGVYVRLDDAIKIVKGD